MNRPTRYLGVIALCLALIAGSCSGTDTSNANTSVETESVSALAAIDPETEPEAADDPAEPEPAQPEPAAAEPAAAAPVEDDEPDEEEPAEAESEPEPPWADGDADYIFDQSELRTYELTIDPDLLAEIDADPAAEEWVVGSLSFEGETLDEVGIRYKGSIGAFFGCTAGGNPFVPEGEKTCSKLSMKLKINEEDKKREFYGQRKLQFHAMNLDPTMMRDRLGYALFREMGVPAPRAVHARLLINGEFAGLFILVEQIDGRFTRANYDDGKGNLYKEVWPTTADGEPVSIEALEDGLKTNEDDPPSFELMQRFSSELVAAGEADARAVVDQYMDVDEVMSYIAVDRTIRHDDGPFHWYCFEECLPHNFYIYENPTAETIHLIPWDLDNAFENIDDPQHILTPVADAWNETQNDCESFPFGPFGAPQRSAACDPLFAAFTQYEAEYADALAAFVEGPFRDEAVTALLDEWSAQIAPVVAEAEAAYDDAPSVADWNTALESMRADLDTARTQAAGS